MAREYIGSRYVPKFMGVYDDTQAYEALCVVDNGQGTSYITRKPTPAGTPLTNEDYWFLYGASSGAIVDLNARVGKLEQNNSPITFSDQSDIKSANLSAGSIATSLGYYAPNDGGGGTYIIVDTPSENSLLYFQLDNGKYAEIMDDVVVLPRYGGTSVHEMFANAIPFIIRHNQKIVVLPPPNPNHPACHSYTENDKNTYFWTTSAPIVITEDYAYTDFYIYGEISATDTIDCVMKISDPLKPEDITFNTSVRLSGWHYDGVQKLVNHALLVEGCARVNFNDTLAAGFAKNCITLGGTNQTNPIEICANILDIGSCTEKGINANGTNFTTTFNFNVVTIQNILDNTATGVSISGSVAWSTIGSLRITSDNQLADIGVHVDPSYTDSEYTLVITTYRSSARLPFKIENGLCKCGVVGVNMAANAVLADLYNSAQLFINLLNGRSLGLTINNNSLYAVCEIVRTNTPITFTGRNIFVNGFCAGSVLPSAVQNSISIEPNGTLIICENGTVFSRYAAIQ